MNRSGTLHLERRPDGVFILTMKTVENRINVSFIKDLNEALDTVECSEGACALITTNESHIYCNGFDLNWVSKHLDQAQLMVQEFMKLIGRILVFPVPTIAALNGHVFAAGCFFPLNEYIFTITLYFYFFSILDEQEYFSPWHMIFE